MALPRKYWGFNLYSAVPVPVPTQSSAVLVGRVGFEPTHPKGTGLQPAATLQLRRLPLFNFIGAMAPIFTKKVNSACHFDYSSQTEQFHESHCQRFLLLAELGFGGPCRNRIDLNILLAREATTPCSPKAHM